jgi:hypothetical protein
MALRRLLDRISQEGVAPRFDFLSRWTETEAEAVPGADAELPYGDFVDPEGWVVSGLRPARAFLRNDDIRHLEFGAETASLLAPDVTVVFLDWGRQPLSWEEIFDLWDAWDSQGMVVDCGPVGVPWALAHRWEVPGWIAFRGDFDGAPLATQVRVTDPVPGAAPQPESFLARAQRLRGESAPAASGALEELPMLPFTLASLENPTHPWPQGAV